MIKIENVDVVGWEHAIRGMRNPKNSWDRSDSDYGCEIVTGSHELCRECDNAIDVCENMVCNCGNSQEYVLGPNDHKLMMSLAYGGPVHSKYRRMIAVYLDITAPLYWWKEFDTYRVGVEKNSCSTMHKIAEKEFTFDDFSCEHLTSRMGESFESMDLMGIVISHLEANRKLYLAANDSDEAKRYWWQMIQLLPSSYNQKRTVMLNYEVLHNIYISRKSHKLDEWRDFCKWIESLPYSELITGHEL